MDRGSVKIFLTFDISFTGGAPLYLFPESLMVETFFEGAPLLTKSISLGACDLGPRAYLLCCDDCK